MSTEPRHPLTESVGTGQSTLEQQGWTRQFTTDESRLDEAVENFCLLGLEIHLEPVLVGMLGEACGKCFNSQCATNHVTIYTRPRNDSAAVSEIAGNL